MQSWTIIATHLLLLCVLLVACVSASEDSVSHGWTKLQISPDVLCSMPYGNFRINIYEHTNNFKVNTVERKKRYFYAPIALLDHKSAYVKHNNATNLSKISFRIEMWNENVQNEVLNYLPQIVDHEIKPYQVQVIPFDKLVVASNNREFTRIYSLSTDWLPYHLAKSMWFSLTCFDHKDCNQLKDSMHHDPIEFHHLQLLFSLLSQTSKTKQVAINFENIISSQIVNKLLKRCENTEYALITVEEENRFLMETTTDIIEESFDDSEVISPTSISQIYRTLRDLLMASRFTITINDDNLAIPLCGNNQTEKMLNEKNVEEGEEWSELNETSLDFPISEISMIGDDFNNKSSKDSGTKIPKVITLSKIKLRKLRDRQSFHDIHVKVRYSTAVLSSYVQFLPFAKLSTTDEWTELKKELNELKIDYQNLKRARDLDQQSTNTSLSAFLQNFQLLSTDYQNLKTDYQSLKSEHQSLKTNYQNLTENHGKDIVTTNTKLSELQKKLETSATPDISFHATRTSPFIKTGQFVPYENVVINKGNGLSSSTGIFTASRNGSYIFIFQAEMNPKEVQVVEIKLNEKRQTRIENDSNTVGNSYSRTSAMSIILSLNVNDKVGVYLERGAIRGLSFFSGTLLRENK